MIWFMTPPWLTFILACIALLVIEEAVSNICIAVMGVWHTKERMMKNLDELDDCRENDEEGGDENE